MATITITYDSGKRYWCKCENCGWENSSEFAHGGTPIADTGDFSDPTCPVCGSNKLDGDSEYVKEETYELQTVEMPMSVFIAPYQKMIDKYFHQKQKDYGKSY